MNIGKDKKNKKHKVLIEQIKKDKRSFILYMVLRILVIAVMIAQFFNGNFENVFFCILTLVLFMVPSFIEVNFHIELPDTLEIIILLFIFAAEILGEIQQYYLTVPHWDTILHTLNGFLAAAIGFSLVDLFNRNERFSFSLSPMFLAVVAFCFSMTIGVLWEFFECGMDLFFGSDMQKDTIINTIRSVNLNPDLGGYLDIGLLDTMKDLFVNFIGAVIFSIIGYFYVKTRGKGRFAKRFIPKVLKEEKKDNNN